MSLNMAQRFNEFPYGYVLYGLRVATNRPRPEMAYVATRAGSLDDKPVNMTIAFLADLPVPKGYSQLPWRLLKEIVDPFTTLRVSVAETAEAVVHRICISNADGYLDAIATLTGSGHPSRLEVYWQNSQLPPDAVWMNVATWTFDVVLSYMACFQIPANLHGCALAFEGRAIALVGAKGAGKSTLGAALMAAGGAMITDDHVALWRRGGEFWVEPGAPRLRLWPTSLSVINTLAEDLPRVYSYHEKRIMNLQTNPEGAGGEFQPFAMPLHTIYLLSPRDPTLSAPAVVALPAINALPELWLHRYSTIAISHQQSARELAVLAEVVQQVRVCRVTRPDGLPTLAQVIEVLRADSRASEGKVVAGDA